MSTSGSKEMAIGLFFMQVFVSAGMHLGTGGFGLLVCFLGVLGGGILVAAGVRVADGQAPIVPVVDGRALAVFVRRNAAAVGLIMASCAVTAVSGEDDPVVCFSMFVLLLLGLTLINIGTCVMNRQFAVTASVTPAAATAIETAIETIETAIETGS